MQVERRQDRRLVIRLPVDCHVREGGSACRALTCDISTGGFYLEVDAGAADDLATVESFRFDMTVPPGAGYSPYRGRLSGTARVLRREPQGLAGENPSRFGIAARFEQPLHLRF